MSFARVKEAISEQQFQAETKGSISLVSDSLSDFASPFPSVFWLLFTSDFRLSVQCIPIIWFHLLP